MQKRLIAMAAVFVLAGGPLAWAEDVPRTGALGETGKLSQTDFKALTDARIGVVKAALQLTPEQQKYWPAIEEAIRTRADARYTRLSNLQGRAAAQRADPDPLRLMRERAEIMDERANGLKKLADAWQPLYQTLSPDQKSRMRVVVTRVIGGLRDAAEHRRKELMDDDDDDEG